MSDPRDTFSDDQAAAAVEATTRDEHAWNIQVLIAEAQRREYQAAALRTEATADAITAVSQAIRIGVAGLILWGLTLAAVAIIRAFQ